MIDTNNSCGMLLNGLFVQAAQPQGEIGMNLLKRLGAIALTALAMLAISAGAASAYYGGWYYDNNAGGSEFLRLGDGEGYYLHLRGASGWCGQRGASYAKMRGILYNDGGEITWWVDRECSDSNTGIDYARICLENQWGESACSTYRVVGWYDWY